MRIGIDCRLWNQTGIGRYIRNLISNILNIDNSSEYILFAGSEDIENIKDQIANSKNKNTKIVEVNIQWHSFAEQMKFPQILNRENLDLMHFPYFSVPILYKRPFVVTMHDLIVNQIDTGRASTLPFPIYKTKRLAYNFVIVNALKNAKKIIVPSHTVKNELIEKMHVAADKIDVTYEGAELGIRGIQKFQNEKIIGKWKLETDNYFLYVGSAYPHKNLERLIEAFEKMNQESGIKNQGLQLVFVGKEDYFYKRLKEKIAALQLDKKIIFTGKVSDEELYIQYKNAKALIIPSLLEGFGLTAVEAMSLGCIVLASDIPVLREICDDAALYFNPKDTSDICQKLEEILQYNKQKIDTLRKKEIERSKIFSWENLAKKTFEIYESCVSLRSSE